MIKVLKSTYRLFSMPHPLSKFEQYVEKKGGFKDYITNFGLIKGLSNFYNCRIKRSGRVCVYYNNHGDTCRLRSGTADVMVFEQIFLFDDYKIDFKTQPQFIVDAGAHIGLASLYFSDRYPQAQIVCLEPEPENYELLKNNVDHLGKIESINSALWHFNGEIFLDNPNANTWAFRVSEQASEKTVPTVDIETILKRSQHSKVGVLKIDIEGSEKTLFASQPNWTNRVDYIVIETHDHIQAGASATVEKALAGKMQLVNRQGENWVYERLNIA